MIRTLICNAYIINEGRTFTGSVLLEGEMILEVKEGITTEPVGADVVINAEGKWLIPGAIDDQVHFREPGLTHKGDIGSEACAAVAGGVTTFMDMPNTRPQTTTVEQLEWKLERAAATSPANYSFFFGGTNDNFDEICRVNNKRIPGIKLFLGASTGNMLVDNRQSLERIFGETNLLIAIHAEKEEIIKRNIEYYTQYGDLSNIALHPLIRSEEACYASSAEAVELAARLGSRLHILHLSTARELSLLDGKKPLEEKKITGEVCLHHLWFCDEDYAIYGNSIKWNPAIKTASDREALRQAVSSNLIDIVATDHAPHLPEEKKGTCLTAASGGPTIQHSVVAMHEMASKGIFTHEQVVNQMSHRPADLFHIDRRGYIREGYYADLVIVNPSSSWEVTDDNILYKCGWSPFKGHVFPHSIEQTYVNGNLVYDRGRFVSTAVGREVCYL